MALSNTIIDVDQTWTAQLRILQEELQRATEFEFDSRIVDDAQRPLRMKAGCVKLSDVGMTVFEKMIRLLWFSERTPSLSTSMPFLTSGVLDAYMATKFPNASSAVFAAAKKPKAPDSDFLHFPSIVSGPSESERDWTGDNSRWYFTEKIDGSQTSFHVDKPTGLVDYYCGSSKRPFAEEPTTSLFYKMMCLINLKAPLLNPNYFYHGETVQELAHSTVVYERTPRYYFIVYHIQDGANDKRWLTVSEMKKEADRLELEMVPVLYENTDEKVNPLEKAQELMKQIADGKLKSILGPLRVAPEGIVLAHPCFRKGNKTSAMKFKWVSPKFVEAHHTGRLKEAVTRLSPTEFVFWVGSNYNTVARYHKAVQHLRDKQKVSAPTQDQVAQEMDADLLKERRAEIEEYLWSQFVRYLVPLVKFGGLRSPWEKWNNDPVILRLKKHIPFTVTVEHNRADVKDQKSATASVPIDATLPVVDPMLFVSSIRRAVLAEFLPIVCGYARNVLTTSTTTSFSLVQHKQ